jgi:hypothetical protein
MSGMRRRDFITLHAAPVGSPWMWTLAFGHHEDRTPTHDLDARGRHGSLRQELAASEAGGREPLDQPVKGSACVSVLIQVL